MRSRRRRLSVPFFLFLCAASTGVGLLLLTLRSVPSASDLPLHRRDSTSGSGDTVLLLEVPKKGPKSCATVEEMGKAFQGKGVWSESLRVRELIQRHFDLNGASRVRELPPEQFCRHGFVVGKASEAGFGNEMYKLLTAAALSVMLNRSLIIGQTRHIGSFSILFRPCLDFKLSCVSSSVAEAKFITELMFTPSFLYSFLDFDFRGKYPFGDYISYSNFTFTLNEVKHLWRHNDCLKKYGRRLVMRIDDFEKPSKTNVLCSNWRTWKQPIIWFQNATDAVAAQFLLKNVHPEMRVAATELFGKPESLDSRPNVFGELMRVLVSPSEDVKEAVGWVLKDGQVPDITLHMRMLMNSSVRAVHAALHCIRKAMKNLQLSSRARVAVVSDYPSLVKTITPNISEFAEVLYFDYKIFKGNVSHDGNGLPSLKFRSRDWGPAPRWVAFVDFFLASRAKHGIISGAHRRVGTTYAQLVAALAAANSVGENSTGSRFSFLSSFQSNLLSDGLKLQVGWGHVWNRFAGPLSCRGQPHQCAHTPLLPPAWWDGLWQSPIPRDIRRLEAYGIQLSGFGTINETQLHSFCSSRKSVVKTIPLI